MVDLRTPKGTVDLSPENCLKIEEIIQEIVKVYRLHNAVPIKTPMFELRSILTNKYGEDAKLIYNLEDQGGDICSLRYDLTVPFSRYLSTNRISRMRRYQIGNVFRRDNPSFKTGRLREFTQADLDICGSGPPMVYDAEVLKIIYDILIIIQRIITDKKLNFVIKINDRRIIMGVLDFCGVQVAARGSICSTIDKIDKMSRNEIKEELTLKGLSESQIDKLFGITFFDGSNIEKMVLLRGLHFDSPLEFRTALDEFDLLFSYINSYGIENIKFDLSLARGLEYYTGMIIEAGFLNSEVGSIIGGGRYDNLCKSISTFSVPCVGFSVGITRLYSLCKPAIIENDVLIGSAFGLMIEERIKISSLLWSNNIRAESYPIKRINFKEQLDYAQKNNFRLAVFTGENERENRLLKIYQVKDNNILVIEEKDLLDYVKNFLLN